MLKHTQDVIGDIKHNSMEFLSDIQELEKQTRQEKIEENKIAKACLDYLFNSGRPHDNISYR